MSGTALAFPTRVEFSNGKWGRAVPVTVLSAALLGIEAYRVEVEVDVGLGMPGYNLVGLPAGSVLEGRIRIRGALDNCGFRLPPRKVVVNLAPADMRKDGAAFDLPIAIGILCAAGVVPKDAAARALILGELSLDGRVKPIRGALSVAALARQSGIASLVVPRHNAAEAAAVDGLRVLAADHLTEVIAFLAGQAELAVARPGPMDADQVDDVDFSEVRGQLQVRRAVEVAAAGGHNLLLCGPPGTGKTLIARRIATVLPPLTLPEALETSKIHSVAGALEGGVLVRRRPFRAPHHSVSIAGLVGGGSRARPGEVSLAHNGVLFLDELPEYSRLALSALRQPVEERRATVVRARGALSYPSAFMLVAAMNPCPCGYLGSPARGCTCSPTTVLRYRSRLCGPLLDRFDLQVEVPALSFAEMTAERESETSAVIRDRVLAARSRQLARLHRHRLHCNAQMGPRLVRRHCSLEPRGQGLLQSAVERLGLSTRGFDRVLRVARTCADLAGAEQVAAEHVAEAIHYRALEREVL